MPLKIRAADAWCRAASHSSLVWSYLYVPQDIFAKIDETSLETLESLCEPSKNSLISEKIEAQLSLEKGNLEKLTTDEFISENELNRFSPKYNKGIQEAIVLFKFLEKKSDVSYAAVFTPLLGSIDEAAKSFIISTLKEFIPEDVKKRERFFEPDLTVLHPRDQSFFKRQESNLKRFLIENDGVMPMGLLKWCLDYAKNPKTPPDGIFSAVKAALADAEISLLEELSY